jgi:hypothetical protein
MKEKKAIPTEEKNRFVMCRENIQLDDELMRIQEK